MDNRGMTEEGHGQQRYDAEDHLLRRQIHRDVAGHDGSRGLGVELRAVSVGGESATLPSTRGRRTGRLAKDTIGARLRPQLRRGLRDHHRREILEVGADETATHLAHNSSAELREGAPDGSDEGACRGFGLLIGEDVESGRRASRSDIEAA
jgi:hypothetical protein